MALPENAIFFMETQTPKKLIGRTLCALESAAMANPNRNVIMLLNMKPEEIYLTLPTNFAHNWKGR